MNRWHTLFAFVAFVLCMGLFFVLTFCGGTPATGAP